LQYPNQFSDCKSRVYCRLTGQHPTLKWVTQMKSAVEILSHRAQAAILAQAIITTHKRLYGLAPDFICRIAIKLFNHLSGS
jgi:hypothetical protein